MENTKADNQGKRYDDGKTRYELIPFDALDEIAKVFTSGAAKYEPRNWERGMLFSRCLGSLMRHIAAWQNGENTDAESGHPHMAHAAWNCIALLTYGLRGTGQDDRPKSAGKDLGDRIQSLLKEQFNTVSEEPSRPETAAVEEQPVCGCDRCELERRTEGVRAVEKQNREAATTTYKAVEIYDHGIFERNGKGDLVPYTGPLLGILSQQRRKPRMSLGIVSNKLVHIRVGDDVKLKDRGDRFHRVLADLGCGKFSVSENLPGQPSNGPIEVVHLRQMTL